MDVVTFMFALNGYESSQTASNSQSTLIILQIIFTEQPFMSDQEENLCILIVVYRDHFKEKLHDPHDLVLDSKICR